MSIKDRETFALALSVLTEAQKTNDQVSIAIASMVMKSLVEKYAKPISELS